MLPVSKSPKPELKSVPDPEVSDRPRRRKFTAKYKLAVLRELDACTEPKKHGRPRKPRNPLAPEVQRLERENARLQEELRKANVIIDVQERLSTIRGISLPETDGSDG